MGDQRPVNVTPPNQVSFFNPTVASPKAIKSFLVYFPFLHLSDLSAPPGVSVGRHDLQNGSKDRGLHRQAEE